MRVFGLTGGIASGKSTVGARFRALRVPVIDADILAREAVAHGSEGLNAIVRAFGDDVLDPNGDLDRKKVAAIVFADPAKRKVLDAIVHPRVSQLTMERSAELDAKGEPLACYEAALIIENGFADAFRPLVVVAAPESVQIARTMERDGATEEAARSRVLAQMPLAEKVKRADIVIENTGTREELLARTDAVLGEVCARLGVDPGRYIAT